MDHIETKILNSYTIQEAAQNMVFAARPVSYTHLENAGFDCNLLYLTLTVSAKTMSSP